MLLVSFASIGYVVYVKKARPASSFTNTTFAVCPNVLIGFDRGCAQMDRIAFTYTSIRFTKNLHVHTTSGDSVLWDLIAVPATSRRRTFARIIWLDFVRTGENAVKEVIRCGGRVRS